MIQIVTKDNRILFDAALTEMHRQRKALFVDQMGWALDVRSGLEIDAFDAGGALYLLDIDDQTGALQQSARLLPSIQPHLLSEVFAYLCPGGVPRGEGVWEVSRFCPSPDTPKGKRRRDLLMRMIAAILETGILFGIDKVTFVAGGALAPLAARAGWDARDLGSPRRHGRDRVRAMIAAVTSDGLKCVRLNNGVPKPITRLVEARAERAA